jgi:surfeit locus 1 family protein
MLTIFTLLALAVLIALGSWQLQRRIEKHALLDSIARRANMPEAPVEILFVTGEHFAAHRAATAAGTFDHAKEVYVYAPRADTGPTRQGFKVLTPFQLSSGDTILVDRGWVAQAQKDPATRAKGQVEGVLELQGKLIPPTPASTFTPPPDLATKTFYVRDTAAIEEALGQKFRRGLIFEAKTRTDGGPEPMQSTLNIPDNHLGYAITWFSLGFALVVIYFRYHYVRGRLRFSR